MPWNQQTVLGYIFEVMYDVYCSTLYFFGSCAILLLFYSICLHHNAFHKMFQYKLSKIGTLLEFYGTHDTIKRDTELLCELIRFHVSIKK